MALRGYSSFRNPISHEIQFHYRRDYPQRQDFFLMIHAYSVGGLSRYLMIFAGFPPTTVSSGTSFVTIDPAAITTLFPTTTPGLMTALPPIHTLSPIVTGFPYSAP